MRMYMEDVTELKGQTGRPREHHKVEVLKELRSYRLDNVKTFMKLSVPLNELPENRLGIINYSPILGMYRYPKNPYSPYNKYHNILTTVFDRMDKSSKINLLFIDLNKSKMDFSSSNLSLLARLKHDIVKRKIGSLLESFMTEFLFYILAKDSLIKLLDNEVKATTFFVFNRNGRQIITNLLTLERQLGGIKDVEDIVKRRYTTRKLPVLNKSQKLKVIDNIFKVTDVEPPPAEEEDDDKGDGIIVKKDTPPAKLKHAENVTALISNTVVDKNDVDKSDDDHMLDVLEVALMNPQLSNNQASTLRKRVTLASNIPSPFEKDKGKSVREASKVSDAEYSLAASIVENLPEAIPEDIKSTRLKDFDSDYVTKIAKKHILSTIYSFNKAGALVTDIKVEDGGTILGETETYIIKFKPLDGEQSTVRIPIPKIKLDGTFTSNGTKYRMTKQHVDLPIRKIDQYEVYLGSNYPSRLAIHRSTKSVDSLERWLGKKIKDVPGVNAVIDNVFDHTAIAPNIYGMLAGQFRSITKGNIHIDLVYANRYDYGTKEQIDKLEGQNYTVCGSVGKEILAIDDNGIFLYKDSKKNKSVILGSVFELFELPEIKAPKALATIKSLGKEYPIVIMLMHSMGLSKLLKYLKADVVVQPTGKRYKEPYDIRMRFEDVDLYVSNLNEKSKMIFQGMVKLEKFTRLSPYEDFDRKDVHPPEGVEYLLLELGYPIRYAIEIDLIFKMFLDPITIDVLKTMPEPTNMVDLLIRGVDMLTTLEHPSVTDSNYMRERGYERIAGMMYKTIVKSMRSYKTAYNPKKRNINISPYEVFNNIIKDPTVSPTEDVNPLGSLKGSELVTYLGDGGRSRETMVAKSRVFHESDVGLLSEAVPDSGSTGINASLSSDPKISNLLGMHKTDEENTYASLYSTSFLSTPGLDKDNPMRAVMSHIQQSHVVGIEGSRSSPIKTGMEYVIPNRTSDMYSNMADEDGVVTNITPNGITVKFKSGNEKIYPLGVNEGYAEGKIYPHRLITDLKKGDKVKKADPVSYNPQFFEMDTIVGHLVHKQGLDIPAVFIEGPEVHEDSCALWGGLGDVVKTSVLYKLEYTIPFGGGVSELPKIGDTIDAGDIVLFIEDEITAGRGSKSKNLNTLQDLTRQAPKSEVSGVIHNIEVMYNGEVKDMSPQLAAITKSANKRSMQKSRERGLKAYNGATFGELRVKGKVIGKDELVLTVYIESKNTLLIGDKFVFGSQLKATLGKILQYPIETESRREAYVAFSYKAASARMAPSAFSVSIANTILRELPIYLAKKHFDMDISNRNKLFEKMSN